MSLDKTTCPFDCYDGCSIVYKDGKLKADIEHPFTNGFLCSKMYRFLEQKRVDGAYFEGKKIALEEALEILQKKISEFKDGKNLFFMGSGNLGRVQNITKDFFTKVGFWGTKGSLCDGAGDAGIVEGRGANLLVPISEIKKSEVVVVWGRDITTSNAHLLPIIKDKKLIVIDPYKSKTADMAEIHLQIKPRGDFYLSLLMARILYMSQEEDSAFINDKTEGFDEFLELMESYHLKGLSKLCDVEIDEVWRVVDEIVGKRTLFLVGIGVQKYLIGHYVLRAIDSLAAMLGLFGKEGCGVSYLSDSFFGFADPFKKPTKRVTLPEVDFGEFDMVFIQGANPLVSMPNTKRVKEGLKKSKFVVYFGLYENETAKVADLILPAVDFLSKSDIKTCYGSEYMGLMPKLKDDECGISEYELSKKLSKKFLKDDLKSETEYIDEILASNGFEKEGYLISKTYNDIPYKDGFYTKNKKFIFLDEFEDDFSDDYEDDEDGKYYLITKKHKHSLNSQFKIDNYLYIPPLLGFEEGEKVKLVSNYGEAEFDIKIDKGLRSDTLLCYAGNRYYNYLTPSFASLKGDNALFQELKVSLKRV